MRYVVFPSLRYIQYSSRGSSLWPLKPHTARKIVIIIIISPTTMVHIFLFFIISIFPTALCHICVRLCSCHNRHRTTYTCLFVSIVPMTMTRTRTMTMSVSNIIVIIDINDIMWHHPYHMMWHHPYHMMWHHLYH